MIEVNNRIYRDMRQSVDSFMTQFRSDLNLKDKITKLKYERDNQE